MSRTWNSRDLEMVESLTQRVGVLSVDQIAAVWWWGASPLRKVRRSLRRLAAAGLLLRSVVNAHPPLVITKPLVQWRPGSSPPDFEAVSRQARKRWAGVPAPYEVYCAGPWAANLFGSTARGPRPSTAATGASIDAPLIPAYTRRLVNSCSASGRRKPPDNVA